MSVLNDQAILCTAMLQFIHSQNRSLDAVKTFTSSQLPSNNGLWGLTLMDLRMFTVLLIDELNCMAL